MLDVRGHANLITHQQDSLPAFKRKKSTDSNHNQQQSYIDISQSQISRAHGRHAERSMPRIEEDEGRTNAPAPKRVVRTKPKRDSLAETKPAKVETKIRVNTVSPPLLK